MTAPGFAERHPLKAGLLVGAAVSAFAALWTGFFGISSVRWGALALCLYGFGRAPGFQGALLLPTVLAGAVLSAMPVMSFLVPAAVAMVAANALTRTESGTRHGIEHAAFALVALLTHSLVQAFFLGPLFALWGLLATGLLLLLVFASVNVVALWRDIFHRRDEGAFA